MNIAIIGSGISGLTAAYYLSKHHSVTVLESADRIGGHTATIDVTHAGERQAVDTGFIVYNDWTYPKFISLLEEIDVETRPTEMSFSVSCELSGIEYAGSNLSTLFADRMNLLRPAHWRMLLEILRFNKEAIKDLDNNTISAQATLGEYLTQHKYSQRFIDKYLVPMGAAIWSSGDAEMLDFPLLFFVRFFKNHGLLSVKNRPQWRTIVGGSAAYLTPLTARFADAIQTGVSIQSIDRTDDNVTLVYRRNGADPVTESFDALVVATHSDQALQLLAKPTALEVDILGAISYQENDVVLHTDESLLPQRRLAWSSWNYRIQGRQPGSHDGLARLTYNMNILQGLESRTTYCVSLNQTGNIDPARILGRYTYSHPVFTLPGIAAQARWQELSGVGRTWFCGAYWGNGFHEDGVASALNVVNAINQTAGITGSTTAEVVNSA